MDDFLRQVEADAQSGNRSSGRDANSGGGDLSDFRIRSRVIEFRTPTRVFEEN